MDVELKDNRIDSHKVHIRYDKDGEKQYWFENDDGEEMYYMRTQINMYNKLYVYVNKIA